LEKRKLRGNLIAPCGSLRKGNGEGGAELFSLGSSDRTHGSVSKLHQRKFRLDNFSLPRWWSNPGIDFLERWSMPQACQCLRGIWTMPLTTGFNFWSALNLSGGGTR